VGNRVWEPETLRSGTFLPGAAGAGGSEEEPVLWRPLSLAATVRSAARRPAARVLLLAWLALTAVCVAAGIYQVKMAWNALPVHLGPVQFPLTIYPPLVICIWMVFWLGFEWAFLSAYLATFALALFAGMRLDEAALFAFVDPLALAVYALAYRAARIPFDLRGLMSMVWFLFVSFVAAVAGSVGSFIWSAANGLPPSRTFDIWQGWWIGALLQAVLLNAPVLALFGRRLERLKARFFAVPPRPEPSVRWAMAAIAAGGLVLAGFLLATGELANTRLSQALQTGLSEASRNAVVEATYSWKLTVWAGIVLALAGSWGGIFLAYAWNRTLFREVRARTAALQESEQRFRMTFDHADVGIAHLSSGGRWLRVNQKLCDIVGYTREELLERTFQDITYPEDLPANLENVKRALAGSSQTYSMQKRYIKKDSSLVWVHVTVALARGTRKEARYFISVVEDITERKLLEEQLRQSQKMEAIGRLAGGVAHDFNNLLTVIGGYGQMMLAQLDERDSLHVKARAICQAADRAAALTSQLLAFSRRQIVQPRIVNLNDLVAGMQEMLHRLLGEAVSLKTIPSKLPAKVKIDPGQFEQVIVNLAVNARDAMPEGGDLTIEISTADVDQTPRVMFCVRDSGTGMDAEVQSHLFEPFYTTKDRGKGTGLGLSIVYGIVKQSGGNIIVNSQLGQGTSFQLFLPRVLAGEPEPAPDKSAAKMALGSETVLLVEDEEALRKLAGEVLRSSGYTVLEAVNGEDAVSVYRRFTGPIPLLVTDMIMPGMNGRALAERLRGLRPDIKVLYISGYTENLLDLHGPLGPATAFLQKPFAPALLTGKVRELLDGPA
jgi:PAS domain S-box-containing protein